ncbi:MAG: enoyl-CoA hydratase-related protein [Pseudobacter sp.]|uniref:enoyl-CoA hydratase-related protein n=1 Tax=Pseudobacter sp. TaxID=2045420 RepID=UPI003F7E00BF
MSSILFSVHEGVGVVTLNRPDKLNSFNREMSLSLQRVLDDCADNSAIRAVYITGAGKGFSAGQDLSEIVGASALSMKQILSEHFNPIVERIRRMPKPVVAAVNGVAAGAGANIALCCDIVVAAQSASFIQAFSKIGLIPDSGGTFFLPRLIGWQKASALAMLGDKVNATEAERMGMIYKVIPDEGFGSATLQLASTLAQMPTQGLALTKHALNQSFTNNYEQQLQLEDTLQQQAGDTEDYREGVNAFVEKRPAVFKGR